jgi:hypothetical protein
MAELPEEEAPILGVRFEASVTEKDGNATDSGLRLLDLRARAFSPLWGGSLLGETHVVGYGAAGWPLAVEPDRQPHALQFDVKGTWGSFESGLHFQSITQGLERITGPAMKPDREGGEVWLAVGLGQFRLRASLAEVSDNVLGDPSRPRTTKTEADLALELKLPAGFLASVGVGQGTSVPSPVPRGARVDRTRETRDFENLTLTFYRYGGPHWDFTLTTTYTESEGRDAENRELVSVVHGLSGSYRPIESLSVTPALSFSQDDLAGGAGSRYLSASMAVAVVPARSPVSLALYGGYTRGYTTDQLSDARTMDALATLTWHLRRSLPTAALAFEVGCSRYVDAVWGRGGYDELRGQVTLHVAGF